MRRLFIMAVICIMALLCIPTASAQTAAVTGHVIFPSGAAPTNAKACFTLQNYKPNIPRIVSTGTIVQQQNWCVSPAADGSFNTSVARNDLISPTGTFWRIDFMWDGLQQSSANYLINHTPFNLDTETPLNVTPVIGPNQIITSCFTFLQSSPAATWTVNHNENDLNVFVTTTDLNGNVIFPDHVTITDVNNVSITWVAAQSGRALVCHGGSISIATNQPNAIISNATSPQTGIQTLNWNGALNTTAGGTHTGTDSFQTIVSSTLNAASTGFLRLASADAILWRNNANTQNVSISKDNIDYFHVNPAAWQQDCPAPGIAVCSTGNFILSNNDNPGVNGEGFNIDFQQKNSAGTQKEAVVFNCGLPDVTAGTEQAVCDMVFYINGITKTVSIGGLLGGGNNAYFGVPGVDNYWHIGKSSQRFADSWVVNSNAAAFFSESANIAQTGGVLRLASADTINWRNNANSGDISLSKTTGDDLQWNSHPILRDDLITINAAPTGSFLQGTDSKLLSSGTISGTAAILCTDANGGATTSGCPALITKAAVNASVCSTGNTAGATCNTTVTWPSSFADTAYSVSCTGTGTITGAPYIAGASKANGSVVVTISNGQGSQAVVSTYGEIDCIGVHP